MLSCSRCGKSMVPRKHPTKPGSYRLACRDCGHPSGVWSG